MTITRFEKNERLRILCLIIPDVDAQSKSPGVVQMTQPALKHKCRFPLRFTREPEKMIPTWLAPKLASLNKVASPR